LAQAAVSDASQKDSDYTIKQSLSDIDQSKEEQEIAQLHQQALVGYTAAADLNHEFNHYFQKPMRPA